MSQLSKMLPACGFVIAAALVGLTSSFKEAPKKVNGFVTYSFEYQPPTTNPYTQASVENDSNWVYNADATDCGGEDKACALLNVPAALVDATGTPTLKPAINIVAVEQNGVAHVTSTSSTAVTISNQDD